MHPAEHAWAAVMQRVQRRLSPGKHLCMDMQALCLLLRQQRSPQGPLPVEVTVTCTC